jgi:hypothetical protein
MKDHLTFDEAVEALHQSSFTICMSPMNGEPITVEYVGWEDETDENSEFIIQPLGCDAIYMDPKQTYKITEDGRGFYVPGSRLMIFPNKPYNFKGKK